MGQFLTRKSVFIDSQRRRVIREGRPCGAPFIPVWKRKPRKRFFASRVDRHKSARIPRRFHKTRNDRAPARCSWGKQRRLPPPNARSNPYRFFRPEIWLSDTGAPAPPSAVHSRSQLWIRAGPERETPQGFFPPRPARPS